MGRACKHACFLFVFAKKMQEKDNALWSDEITLNCRVVALFYQTLSVLVTFDLSGVKCSQTLAERLCTK